MPREDEKDADLSPSDKQDGRSRSKFRRTKKVVKLFRVLNGPFFVTVFGGLIVFFISQSVEHRYSQSQERFQVRQGLRQHKIQAASAALEEIIRALSKRFTGIGTVVGAYRQHYGKAQYSEAIDYDNAVEHEWDQNQEVLELKIDIYFPDIKIKEHWHSLVKGMDDFDEVVTNLNDKFRGVTRSSKALDDAIASADRTIDHLEADLRDFAHELNDFINRDETRAVD